MVEKLEKLGRVLVHMPHGVSNGVDGELGISAASGGVGLRSRRKIGSS